MFSSAARRFEVPRRTRGILCRNFKSAALAAICPFYRLYLAGMRVAMAPTPRLWESAGYSNQVFPMICLEMRF
jgi:hypothetical protein